LPSPSPAAADHGVLPILDALVGFDTTSHRSNLALIGWVEEYLARHGVASVRIPDETGEKASLFASIGPKDQPGFVLSGHTDVVPVEGQVWSSDPFRLRVAGDRAYGRGATDMKGFLAACLSAVPSMVAAPLQRPIHLAFSYDEEVGCVGVRPMLEQLAAGAFGIAPPLAAFIGEPTGMGVVIGHKGKVSLKVVVRGSFAHSSLAPRYVNAVEYGARLVAFIAEQGARLKASGARDALYDIAHSTAHVGVFRGGSALNIVPDRAEFLCEYRVIGADSTQALVAELTAFARDALEPAMRAVDPEAGIDISIYAGFPGLDTAEDASVASLAKRLAARNDHAKVAYGTEAGLFTAIAGIPAVVVGPGDIDIAHKPDEFITLAELQRCEAFLGRLIAEACV
jgi:acetylornithine deacetylase